jgi:flagellar export protein FliJ
VSRRRIDTVVRVRAIHERLARGEVARRRAELERRREAEAAAWAALRRADDRSPTSAPPFLARRDVLRAGVVDAAAHGERTALAAHHVDAAMDGWRDAARRLDGIERLAERLRAEAAAEQERRTRVEIDDLVIARWPTSGDDS